MNVASRTALLLPPYLFATGATHCDYLLVLVVKCTFAKDQPQLVTRLCFGAIGVDLNIIYQINYIEETLVPLVGFPRD